MRHPTFARISRRAGEWNVEAYLDLTCWMVGINFATPPSPAFYVHVGPIIVGAYRCDPAYRTLT